MPKVSLAQAPAIQIVKMDEAQMEKFKSLLDGFQDLLPPAPKAPLKPV